VLPSYDRFLSLVHPEDRSKVSRAVEDALSGRTHYDLDFRLLRPDASVGWLHSSAEVTFDAGGHAAAMTGVVLDITEGKQAEEALREADRRKDEFIAILSHELRNPLAPIRYALPLLSEERLGDGGRRAVAVIDRQAAHLARLVDDLLDVSRITAGKIELRRDRVTLAALVAAAVEAASPAIAAGRHSLDIAVPDEPVWLDVDATRISQAITNLLNNSAKYTPAGGRVRLEATYGDDHAVLRVRDNGIGIAPEALPAVFEMFRQVGAPNRTQGGLGVGLTLTKQFVEMHGGTVEAHSAGEHAGAEFVIRLPLAPAGLPRDEQRAPGASGQAACLRVLVVDDNVDLVDMLAMVVEAAGHDARKAFDGRSAVSAALEYQPHVILLDVGMPGMNGFEVATELRRHPHMARTRIVALTGWGQAEDRRRTAQAGFDDHLTKPTDPQQIELILREVAQRITASGGA
jgi:two-component system CheB/CheR fusion protein